MRQRIQGVIGDVRLAQFIHRARQNTHHIHRHIPHTDHRHTLDSQVKLKIAIIRVAVVPGDKLRRRAAAGQVFAGDFQRLVGLRAHREDDGMVMAGQIIQRDVRPELHVAEKPEARPGGNFVIDLDNGFDLWMIRRDPAAHQPIGCGQTVKHINLNAQVCLLLQVFSGVKARRS